MLQKMKGVLKGHFRIVFETIFPGGLHRCVIKKLIVHLSLPECSEA